MKKTFTPGDHVAWSHVVGPEHADGSIVTRDAVASRDRAAQFGIVQPPADGQADSHHLIAFEDGARVLTSDELVKIAQEAQ